MPVCGACRPLHRKIASNSGRAKRMTTPWLGIDLQLPSQKETLYCARNDAIFLCSRENAAPAEPSQPIPGAILFVNAANERTRRRKKKKKQSMCIFSVARHDKIHRTSLFSPSQSAEHSPSSVFSGARVLSFKATCRRRKPVRVGCAQKVNRTRKCSCRRLVDFAFIFTKNCLPVFLLLRARVRGISRSAGHARRGP